MKIELTENAKKYFAENDAKTFNISPQMGGG